MRTAAYYCACVELCLVFLGGERTMSCTLCLVMQIVGRPTDLMPKAFSQVWPINFGDGQYPVVYPAVRRPSAACPPWPTPAICRSSAAPPRRLSAPVPLRLCCAPPPPPSSEPLGPSSRVMGTSFRDGSRTKTI